MKKNNILRRYLTVVILSFFFVALLSVVIVCLCSAQTLATQGVVIKGLMLSPLRAELNIASGTSLDGTLTVTNSTGQSMTVNLEAEEFKVTDKDYDYEFIADTEVSKWATFQLSEVVLKAGESQKIKYTVGVPLTAEPGGILY